jgi:hypothetical protein
MSMADRIDRALDAALDMTFPASDPIAVGAAEGGLDLTLPNGAYARRTAPSARRLAPPTNGGGGLSGLPEPPTAIQREHV